MRHRRPAHPVLAAVAAVSALAAACSPLSSLPLPSLVAGVGTAATPAPSVSPAPPSTAPGASSPGPASAAQRALAVLENVKAWGAGDATSFKVAFTGELRYPTGIATVKGTLLVDGGDAQEKVRFDFPDTPPITVQYRRVGGEDWSKTDGERWKALKAVKAADMVDPFRGIREGTRLTWLGPVEGEADEFLVETEGVYLHPVLIPSAVVTDEKIRSGKLRLVVRADGTPVRATWNMRGNVRVQDTQVQGVAFDLELDYSDIGDDFDIRKP